MSGDNHSFGRENPWYPRHVSDRADELCDELDEVQLRQLYDALKNKTLSEWLIWLEEARAEVAKYDWLRRAERKRRLQKRTSPEVLLLHHACVFVELWRARMESRYFHLPPRGLPLNEPEAHREMLLAVLASYNAFDARDLWPFEFPEGEDHLPFRSEPS
jgi:hypothetical protein